MEEFLKDLEVCHTIIKVNLQVAESRLQELKSHLQVTPASCVAEVSCMLHYKLCDVILGWMQEIVQVFKCVLSQFILVNCRN